MRVIFQTPPTPNITVRKPDGTKARGRLYFSVRLFDPGETIPPDCVAEPLSQWRKNNGSPDGSIRQRVPLNLEGTDLPRVGVVPAGVLKPLPEDALIGLTWHLAYDEFVPARGS